MKKCAFIAAVVGLIVAPAISDIQESVERSLYPAINNQSSSLEMAIDREICWKWNFSKWTTNAPSSFMWEMMILRPVLNPETGIIERKTLRNYVTPWNEADGELLSPNKTSLPTLNGSRTLCTYLPQKLLEGDFVNIGGSVEYPSVLGWRTITYTLPTMSYRVGNSFRSVEDSDE